MSSVQNTKSEESLDFSVMFPILQKMLNIKTQEDLAQRLGIQAQSISNAKAAGRMPAKWILRLAQKTFIPWDRVSEIIKTGGQTTLEKPLVESVPIERPVPVAPTERRRCHKLRAMINAISRSQVALDGLPEIV